MELKLTFDLLPILAAAFSVLAWIVPKFNDWYNSLVPELKQLVMAGILLVCAIGASLLSLFGLVQIYPADQGLIGLVWLPLVDFVIALMTNAGVYKATNKIFEKRYG